MKVKQLVEDRFQVVAVMDGDDCPAESFILNGEESTRAAREGLLQMLTHVANRGLQGVSSTWFHEADKRKQIYEFIKGPLRLFFFKGQGRQIVVCTSGVRKSANNADQPSVSKAFRMKNEYFAALQGSVLEVITDETQ